ncbi:MAG: SDR family NAD(P)-dependent oxidoreductase [Chloroflexi bacterium]|nr:SDR family NAD(P)-dependent oxidoreductase [Chloroflexota bacterium]
MTLRDKVAVITGAARGMGRAYVKDFLDEGAKIAALDLSWKPTGFSGDKDDAFYRQLLSRPGDVITVTCDLGDPEQVESAYEATMEKFGTADILINNAGVRQRDLFPPTGRITTLETSRSDWERMFDVTVFGAMDLTKRFIQPMIEKRRGSIVTTISSGALHHSHGGAYMALRPNSREVPYQPAKAAILCAMFYLADEVREHNVAVNIIVPGHTRSTGFDEQNAFRRSTGAAGAGQPGRGPTALVPEHMVPLVKLLAQQEASSGVTGRCFDVMTWNMEHGLGGAERWADTEAEAGIQAALASLGARS